MARLKSTLPLLGAAVLAGTLLLAMMIFWWFYNEQQRGITFAPPAEPIPWTDVPQGGINLPALHLEQPETIARTFERVQAAGMGWVRVQFPWEDLEIHGKGDFRDFRHDYDGNGVVNEDDAIDAWAKYDALVAAAAAHDLTLIVRLDRPPAWARQNLPQQPHQVAQRELDPGTGPPDSLADYGDYVEAVVGRYRGQVRFFQIWNEPNYGHEWNWADPDPLAFVELLKLGYSRVKVANPQAVVLFPSLTPADGLDWKAMNDLDYLEQVYEAGGAAYFDIFTAQLYGLGQPPHEHRYVRPVFNEHGQLRRDLLWSRPLDTRTDVSRAVLLREIMQRYGDAQKAIWISEFGWNSHAGPHPFGLPTTEEQKAEYLVGLMQRARHEWPWMGVMNIWFLRAGAGFHPDDPTVDFQLIREDWHELPAYAAIQAYLTAPVVAGPGTYTPHHPALVITPQAWTFRFWGTRVEPEGAAMDQLQLDGQAITPEQLQSLKLGEYVLSGTGTAPTRIQVWRANPWRSVWVVLPFILFGALWLCLYKGLSYFARV